MSQAKDGGTPKPPWEALAERLREAVLQRLDQTGALTEESLERALKEAREWAAKLKEQYGDDLPRAFEQVRRDYRAKLAKAREQSRQHLDPERIGAGVLGVARELARQVGMRLNLLAAALEARLTRKAGGHAGPGTYTCNHCGQTLHIETPMPLPPCPHCRNTEFRRGY
jgi:rubrerythrin